MWTFPSLAEPSVFVAAPGDLAYLREAVARELDALQRKVADDHGIRLYDWQVDKAEDGFRDWVPPQGQIPLPSDPQCRAVICMLGERIGTPMPVDFDTGPLGPLQALDGERARLVHPWEPGAEERGGFALTGTVFEYLAALHANRTRVPERGSIEHGRPPVLLLVVGDDTVRQDLSPLDANWGGHRLFEAAEQRFRESHGSLWRSASREWEDSQYLPQVTQLRNFLRYLEGVGVFPRLVADEEQARAEIRAFLARELDLRVHEPARDPFKGLQVYDREDSTVFVGRETERREAVAELTALWEDASRPTFYGVIGGSGVGKSSLARAGIVGHLCHQTARGNYLACIVRPDELLPEPLPRLFAFAMAQADPSVPFEQARASMAAVRDELEAGEAVRLLGDALGRRGAGWRLLLAFDQFEELLDRRTDEAAAPLWAPVVDFIALAARHPAIGVVYTLQTNRAELIAQDPKLGPLWARGGNLRLAFPEHSLDEIIRKPFEIAGVAELEPELVRTLRERIVRFAHQSDGESTGSLLPLVSLTLRRIFEASRRTAAGSEGGAAPLPAGATPAGTPPAVPAAASGPAATAGGVGAPRRLGLQDCAGLLDVEGAIAELAQAAVQEARTVAGADWSDEAIGSLLRRLVRLSGAANDRLVLPDAPMPSAGAPRRLATALMQRRLLLPEAGGRIKLVHEAVLRHWPAASTWLDGQRRLLRLAGIVGFKAEEWDAGGRTDASLATHGARDLDEAAELLAQWFDVLGGEAAGEDSRPAPADRRLRDYGLALLRVHPAPRRLVEGSASGSSHLHLASGYGDLPLVQTLLGADPAAVAVRRRDGRTPIFGACQSASLPVLAALVAAGADLDHADADGWRPLHLAANAGRVPVLDALLAAGASMPLACDGSVTPPLYLAASNGHVRMVERLLALGADPAQAAGDGWTPLHAAASEGHAECVRLLAGAGAPTEARLAESGHTAIHLAAVNGHEEALRTLAACGAALDATVTHERRERCTALHLAVLRDRTACARALLQTGAAPDARDSLGQTPLYLALATGRLPMASELVGAGADPDAPARDGHPCLHLMVRDGDEARARFLLEQGARPDVPGPSGRTALHRAAADGREDLLRLLLEAGANPVLGDDEGNGALHHAARRGQQGVLGPLLTLPTVKAEAVNADGLTAAHLAAEAGHVEALRLLLARGAPVDAADADGWTPLHLAALGGHAAAAQALLAAGATVDARSSLPETRALIVAAELGHVDVVRALLDAGADLDGDTAHKPAPLASALRYRQFDAARTLLDAGARLADEDAAWSTGLPDDREDRAGRTDVAADGAHGPGTALRCLFNARGPGDAAGAGWSVTADTGAQAALESAQARLLTANAGVLQYRWRPAADEVRALVASDPGLSAAGLRTDGAGTKVQVTGLAWYERALLVRVCDPGWPNPALTAYFVLDAAGALVRLPGVSTPLHDLAASEPLRLTPANVLGYLKFFCFFVRGDEGAFYILEQPDDPMVPSDVSESLRRVLRETVRPAFLDGRDEQGRYVCEAVVWYSNALFIARFGIGKDGSMEMLSDEPIAADLPIRAEAPIA